MRIDWESLFEAAKRARMNAYCPYSVYPVGAAVLTESGSVFAACNVENVSYPLSNCAERNAVCAMVAGGDRKVIAVAVLTRDGATPCGGCRQILAEFADGAQGPPVRCYQEDGTFEEHLLSELLPYGFDSQEVEKNQ